jgi:hypothetical protein
LCGGGADNESDGVGCIPTVFVIEFIPGGADSVAIFASEFSVC